MGKIEAKKISSELQKDMFHPVYFLEGTELKKIREMKKRIFQEYLDGSSELEWKMSQKKIDLSEDKDWRDADTILFELQSPILGSTKKILFVDHAEYLKDFSFLLSFEEGKPKKRLDRDFILVLTSKKFDTRKKNVKKLLEMFPWISCDEVQEDEKASWIQYLWSQRKKIKDDFSLQEGFIQYLLSLDPWSLDRVESEIEKWELFFANSKKQPQDVVKLESFGQGSSDQMVNFYLQKNKAKTLEELQKANFEMDFLLPVLGLLHWNLQQLVGMKLALPDQKIPAFIRTKLQSYQRCWSMDHLNVAISECMKIDFKMKQTTVPMQALWSDFVQKSLQE